MSDIREWINERATIHAASGGGRWEKRLHEHDYEVWEPSEFDDVPVSSYSAKPDATAIVDSHNMFPRALDALGKVLELHSPATVYTWAEECSAPGSHEAITDVRSGDMLCEDEPIGRFCNGCVPENDTTIDVDEYPWPCPTVQAIEGAIND